MSLNPSQLYQALRAILEPMGFEKDPDVIAAIGFRGTVAGRLLRVSAAVRGRNIFTGYDNTSFRVHTGIAISITTETPICTRLTVGTSPLGWLATRVFLPRLRLKPVPAAEGIEAWAFEEDWADRYMATDAFREIASDGADLSVTALVFTPERVSLSCFPRTDQLDSATMDRWLRLTADLAAAAEADPPRLEAQRTWLELQSKKTQVAVIVGALFGVPLMLLGLFGLGIGAVLLILTLFF